MFNIICVTNRKLVKENFLDRIEKIARNKPSAIILREKDLTEEEYYELAKNVKKITDKYNVKLTLHSFPLVAIKLGVKSIHLPLNILKNTEKNVLDEFNEIGSSVHSEEDVKLAISLGVTYVTAGHIFETDCKKGLPGRGISFLKNICDNYNLPIYGIGGITEKNVHKIEGAGASGACIMSEFMTTNNIKKLVCGNFLKLYAITDYELSDTELLEKTEAALKAGVTCVQLREKNLSKEELIKKAIKLKALCDRYNAVFIVNDYFEVALEVHADGVHVGLDDADVALIRERAGADFIIGATAKTVEVAREAEKKGADYLGVGAMFHSSTKGEARVITKDEFKNIANSVNIPLVAIGGITAENVSEISNMGQAGIAVVGAVYGTDDTEAAVKNLLEKS